MAINRVLNIAGVNTYVNPLLKNDGELLIAKNVESYPYGAKRKRPGYITYLGTADGNEVNTIFSWLRNDGTTLTVYRASGSSLYSSNQGTASWQLCGNGTIGNGSHVGYAVLDNILAIGDGEGSARHSSNGTSFTNTSLAPVGEHLVAYQNRMFIGGTSSTLFYSNAIIPGETYGGTASWDTTSPNDSASFNLPGAGKINSIFISNDRVVSSKTSGRMFTWDNYELADMSTTQGPSSPYSVAEKEGYHLWLNRDGIQSFGGGVPTLISNPIQSQIYNDVGDGISGSIFDDAPATIHHYDYLTSVGTVTDDLLNETYPDNIIKYNFQKNEFVNWQFEDNPTSWHSLNDIDGDRVLVFGDSGGQCYKMDGSANTDNGTAIEAEMVFSIHLGAPDIEKEWKRIVAIFNPGCEAKVQVAFSDSFSMDHLVWVPVDDSPTGIYKYRFEQGARSRLLFVRIHESSKDTRFIFYGFTVEAEPVGR